MVEPSCQGVGGPLLLPFALSCWEPGSVEPDGSSEVEGCVCAQVMVKRFLQAVGHREALLSSGPVKRGCKNSPREQKLRVLAWNISLCSKKEAAQLIGSTCHHLSFLQSDLGFLSI